ncbi:MAG TPA: phage terminase large subunit [Terricaulis sp.]|nr:phage terminase large subunit [Terricaulis sp.]
MTTGNSDAPDAGERVARADLLSQTADILGDEARDRAAESVKQQLEALGFTLSPKQKQVRKMLGGPETHCLVYGGSRSGKTFLLVYAVVMRALKAPGSRHLIARKATKHVKASVFLDTFPKVMRLAFPGVRFEVNKSDLYVTFYNGRGGSAAIEDEPSQIWFGGLDDKERVEKILGQEYATVYVNECSQLSYDAIVLLRSRLAQNCTQSDGRPLKLKAYYDLNPTGKSHWTYKEFVAGVDPKSGKALTPGRRCFATINPKENPHLPKQYLDEILADMPERQRVRFQDGQYINEVPGALWKLEDLEEQRLDADDYDIAAGTITRNGETISLQRVVIGVDPMVAKPADGENWDLGECGIVAAALGDDGRAYVLMDGSERLAPDGWAKKALSIFHALRADRIVAEQNNGGEMVRLTIKTADDTGAVPIDLVSAARGKITRAEPHSARYAQKKVSHVGHFPELEDQMTSYTGAPGENSPDRMDALVWCLHALFEGVVAEPFILIPSDF